MKALNFEMTRQQVQDLLDQGQIIDLKTLRAQLWLEEVACMPETETRMSRYHGKDKHRSNMKTGVKGAARKQRKRDWPAPEDQDQDLSQTQVYF